MISLGYLIIYIYYSIFHYGLELISDCFLNERYGRHKLIDPFVQLLLQWNQAIGTQKVYRYSD